MSQSIPILGYPSKTAAIMALHAEGKTTAEIAALVGHTPTSVLGTISLEKGKMRRKGAVLSPLVYEKARRIYREAIIVIADALHIRPEDLHHDMSKASIDFNPVPAPPAEQAGGDAEPMPVTADKSDHEGQSDGRRGGPATSSPASVSEPEKPVLVTKPMTVESTAPQVYLKNPSTGYFLHFSGEVMTADKNLRWKGSQAQATACKARFPLAKDLRMVSALPMPQIRG